MSAAARLTAFLLSIGLALTATPAIALTLQNGDIVVLANRREVFRVDPATGTADLISSVPPLATLVGVGIEPGGTILVADSAINGGDGRVLRINPRDGSQQVLTGGGLIDRPSDLFVSPSGEILLVDAGRRALYSIDPISGTPTEIVASGIFNCFSDAVSIGGSAFVSSSSSGAGCSGAIWEIDLATSDLSVLSRSSAPFSGPNDVAVDETGGLFAVGLVGQNAIVQVDPTTGEVDVLNPEAGEGILDLALGQDEIFATDVFARSVVGVNRVTGAARTVATGFSIIGNGITVFVPEPHLTTLVSLAGIAFRLLRRPRRDGSR